eukprot:711843-Ditylum_brightwellii.AAC.1
MFICPEENCTFPFHVHDENLPFLPRNERNDLDYSQCWNHSYTRQNIQDNRKVKFLTNKWKAMLFSMRKHYLDVHKGISPLAIFMRPVKKEK